MKLTILTAVSAAVLLSGFPAFAQGLDGLSPDESAVYELVDPALPLGPSAYQDWKAPDGPPWKIGFASIYAGNTWQASALDELINVLAPEGKEQGLIEDVVVLQSDFNDTVQIQNMRQLVDDGADALIICCSNVTALNSAIEYAHSKDVPTFVFSGYTTSPYSVHGAANHTQGGYEIGKWLAEEIGGSGNVLMVSGVQGTASSNSFDEGALKALAEFPDIQVVGTVAGNWTDQIAQVEVQRFLATFGGEIDGIVTQSAQENGVLNALLQSGRPLVPVTLGGEASAACFWRKNPDFVSSSFHIWPPRREMDQVWDIMIRTLKGDGPKTQSMLRPVLPYTIEDVNAALPEDCDLNSTDWVEPSRDAWFPKAAADQYFARAE